MIYSSSSDIEIDSIIQSYSEQLDYLFERLCITGHLNHIKKMIVDYQYEVKAQDFDAIDYGFRKACEYGHLDVVKYLLTSPDIKKHPTIHLHKTEGFHWACLNGHIDIVRYLLTSVELTKYANVHEREDEIFKNLCLRTKQVHFTSDNIERLYDTINYLIFDYQIEETSHIKQHATDFPDVAMLFRKREHIKLLEKELSSKNITLKHTCKNKI